MSHLVSENWDEICAVLEKSEITEFRPKIVLDRGGRAVSGVDFDGVARRRAEILAGYGRYVKTDIARFYPSVYTHSIAWAILGKEWVKTNIAKSEFKNSFANLLDKAVAAGQSGQTIGIPIGPDTSRVLSEAIASRLEESIRREIADLKNRAVRYLDDMLIGLAEIESSDAVLSKVSAALAEYELELNGEKTSLHGVGHPHPPDWVQFVRGFDVSDRADRQREDIDSYFDQVFHLADANHRDNVLLFAARRAASFKITRENLDHLIRWLLYSARRSTACLNFVVEHLASTHSKGDSVPLDEIYKFICQQIPVRAEAAHTSEVAWLIFWARELQLALPASLLERVTRLESGANALLTYDMLQRGLVDGNLDTSRWESYTNADGLKSHMWLVAYEVAKKDWWQRKKKSSYVSTHSFFGDLWDRNVEFYDPRRRARPQVGRDFFGMLAHLAGAHGPYPG